MGQGLTRRELEDIAHFCQRLAGIGKQLGLSGSCFKEEECMMQESETGQGTCSLLPEAARVLSTSSCYSLASDALFAPAQYDECFAGVRFEARKLGTTEWVPIYNFPIGVDYCDDGLKIVFDPIQVNGETLNLSEFDIQFTK